MKLTVLSVALATFLAVGTASAQDTTKPIRYTWIADSCQTWNRAAAALVLANGAPDVIVLPTTSQDRPWLILRRIEEGSVFIPEDEPFVCEVFGSVTLAGAAFTAMDNCQGAILLNVPDGHVVVASLSKCTDGGDTKRRAVN